jgi:hypothetical protein
MTVSIGKPTRLRHAQFARNDLDFDISVLRLSLRQSGSDIALTPAAGQPRRNLRVCHHALIGVAPVNPIDAPIAQAKRKARHRA